MAVGAARRLRCAARSGLASRNSLRSLAHSAQTGAASQTTKRAARAEPGPALLLAPEIAPAGHRLPRVEPRAGSCSLQRALRRCSKGACGQAAARLGGAEERGSARAQRASSTDSPRLSERSERSERSEFGDGATRPSIAGQSALSADRLRKRRGLPARAFAARMLAHAANAKWQHRAASRHFRNRRCFTPRDI